MRGFTTIGHSNRPPEVVIEMLREAEVQVVADVRTFPRSRKNPVFNLETFPEALGAVQIGYGHWPALGGRRPRQPEADPEVNALWRVRSFHNYADYALRPEFEVALDELIALGRERRLALMCAEAVWWRCHRRIITDHLLARGLEVLHLMGPGQSEAARLTPGAVVSGGTVIYPAPEGQATASTVVPSRSA